MFANDIYSWGFGYIFRVIYIYTHTYIYLANIFLKL